MGAEKNPLVFEIQNSINNLLKVLFQSTLKYLRLTTTSICSSYMSQSLKYESLAIVDKVPHFYKPFLTQSIHIMWK